MPDRSLYITDNGIANFQQLNHSKHQMEFRGAIERG